MAKKKTVQQRKPKRQTPLTTNAEIPNSEATCEIAIEHKKLEMSADDEPGFPVVGIGASAGGLEALEELFKAMPVHTGMAFVVLTHQHPDHVSLLPELLGRKTSMPVEKANEGVSVLPDHIYVGMPGGDLVIHNRTLHRKPSHTKEVPHLLIDHFFRSLAEDQQERAIGIILSGTGSDGTLGVTAIKGASGMVMVQQPQSAKYAGMPSSAIATKLADYVLPPSDMPKQLIAYAQGPYLATARPIPQPASVPAEPMMKILKLLRSCTGHDFSEYKSSTIHRRIERRMNLHQIESPNQYARYLQENPHEVDTLFKELLISVTSFFRDAEAWDALSIHLLDLIKSRPEDSTLRIWDPGCATGEEVYSLAITLRECMEQAGRQHEVQIFGSDLDAVAIARARNGLYPDGIASDVSPQRLERYFLREDGYHRIRKEVREMTVFALQNVIKDPPFSRLDVVSCRNLLIYLNADLQKKLLPIFHYSLKPGGLLFLGSSETVEVATDLFEPLDKHWKIYRRRESTRPSQTLPVMPSRLKSDDEPKLNASHFSPSVKRAQLSTPIERLLLATYVPTCVVVNDRGDIMYIHGRTGRFLELAPGEPRTNILEMAREDLRHELAESIRECVISGDIVTRPGLPVNATGKMTHTNLSVTKLQNPPVLRDLFLVTFQPPPADTTSQKRKKPPQASSVDEDRIVRLEDELRFTRESQQAVLEELETSNEELNVTNEELQSTNEELQSTNEELETSKEELQSLNEELTTVNAELHSKVDELTQTNDDMQNLLNSTEIGTVFLDNDLNIKRFTEHAKELVMLRPSDVGRPISELASNLKIDDLQTRCRNVLKTLEFQEARVETSTGGRFLMRIMPYRTAENAIDGLVLTFVNIQQVEKTDERARVYFQTIFDTVREPLLVLDQQLRVISANTSFYRVLQCSPGETVNRNISELGSGCWEIRELPKLLDEILVHGTHLNDFEIDLELPDHNRRCFVLNARRLKQLPNAEQLILVAIEDVTGKSNV